MLIKLLKEQGFFENRIAILKKAKSYGLNELWVILPKGGTGLYEDRLHLMYTFSDPENTPLENEFLFLKALEEEFHLKCEIELHSQLGIEENLLSLTGKFIARARLESVIPFENLVEGVELEEQTPTPLPIPSDEDIEKRIQEVAERFRSRDTVPAPSEVGDLKASPSLTTLISPSSPIFSRASVESNTHGTEKKQSPSFKRKSFTEEDFESQEFTDFLLELPENSIKKLEDQIERVKRIRQDKGITAT